MLSESTARLVEAAAVMGEPEMVHIKGADELVSARRLHSIGAHRGGVGRRVSTLVGRGGRPAIATIGIATERWPTSLGFEGHMAMAEAMP